MLKKNQYIILFIIIILIRVILTYLTPLAADESYYLLWASHLDLSYVDHPGMVSWINYLFILIFREPLLAIRTASLTLLLFTLFFIYKTASVYLSNKESIWKILILFVLIPYNFFFGITMQVEQPLLLFSSACIYLFVKLIKTENKKYLYGLGLTTGLGLLSKYTFILLPLFIFLYILFNNKLRKTLISVEFILSFFLALVILLPLLIWNYQHDYISFLFHTRRLGTEPFFKYTLTFLSDQLLYFSPIMLYYLIKAYRKKNNLYLDIAHFFVSSFFIFSIFFTLSIITKVWGHWTAIMFIPFSIYIGIKLESSLNSIIRSQLIFNILLTFALLFTGPSVISLHDAYQNNYKIVQDVNKIQQVYKSHLPIYADLHGSVGLLSYYLKQTILFPEGEFKGQGVWGQNQFELWNNTTINLGDSILYFTYPTPEILLKLQIYFNKVSVYPEPKLTLMEGYINKYRFILCSEAKYSFVF
ncbi:MAG: hypothetical protein A2Y40_04295 [Candidatus Margulisbacteria bacterium GWF2_35_9]|nr:MAG: hypothetical protein A2Y40_04295 [Candidatus Margulisbacteria bacterium GWF2_35_9]